MNVSRLFGVRDGREPCSPGATMGDAVIIIGQLS